MCAEEHLDILQLAKDVIEKAEGLSVPLPLMMSPNVLRPGIISTKLPEHFMVASDTEWDDGEYLVAAANAALTLAAAVIRQEEDIAALRAALGQARDKLDAIREMAIEDLEKDLGGTNLYQIEADAHAASAAIDGLLPREGK